MDIKAQRLEILRQVEDGEISLEEADRWLAALEKMQVSSNNHHPGVPEEMAAGIENQVTGADPAVTVPPDPAPVVDEAAETPVVTEEMPAPAQTALEAPIASPEVEAQTATIEEPPAPMWRGWWLLVFVPGFLLLIASVNWMVSGMQAAGLSWGFWLSFIPFTIGVLMLWLGWEIRIARWLHLHVQQKHGSHPHEVMISFPLPTGLVSWGVRRFGHFASPVHGKDIGDFLNEVDQSVASDGPMHIFVDDPDGDRVEIWVDGPRSR